MTEPELIDPQRAQRRADMLAAIITTAKSQTEQALTVIKDLQDDLGGRPIASQDSGERPHMHPLLQKANLERHRQIFEKGSTSDHDDTYAAELRQAAVAYITSAPSIRLTDRDHLVRAVALLMAEWDRMERAEQQRRRQQVKRS